MKFISSLPIFLFALTGVMQQTQATDDSRALRGSGPQILLDLPPTDGSAASITQLVLKMIEVGMDKAQIMGILHSRSYTMEYLQGIFEGDDEDNEVLMQALQPLLLNQEHSRHLQVAGERMVYSPEEFDARLEQAQKDAEASFYQDGHRTLASACSNIVQTNIGREVAEAYDDFTQHIDIKNIADLFDKAPDVGARKKLARMLKSLPSSMLMLCVADALDTTISVEFSFDATILFFNADFGLNIIFGEDEQFAVARTTGFGFDLGLAGVGVAAGVSLSNRIMHGGFDTIASSFKDPDICFSVGYTPFVVGGAITFALTPGAASTNAENTIIDKFNKLMTQEGLQQFEINDILDMLLSLGNVATGGKMTSIGVEATIGVDVLDLVGAKLILPDLSIHACTEKLLICDGSGCESKLMEESWEDGTLCGIGSTCDTCENTATYWHSKGLTACGSEPKWTDGTICALGTTCNSCQNSATYWWGKAFTACGTEPKWIDGTRCLAGTSCNACKNGYEWWDSKVGHHCGKEPCWGSGTVCGAGTTCNSCCGSANCPWYQFGVCNCN